MKSNRMHKLNSMVLATMLFVPALGVAQTATGPNDVYIEQVGNSNAVTIEQVGGTNRVGGTTTAIPSSSNYGTITGSTNTVLVKQTGDNNLEQYNIRGNNNNYSVIVLGGGNSNKLNIGSAGALVNLRNSVTETVTGDNNTIVQTLLGNDINSTLTVTGSTNDVAKELYSSRGTSAVTITGGNNKLEAEQLDSAGANGHILTALIVGGYNSIVTQQQGSNDTTIDLKIAGDNNTVTVRTSSTSIVGPRTAVVR